MPKTDWEDKVPTDAAWLRAQLAKPAPRMGACLFCGADKCGCFQNDVFGPHADRVKGKNHDPRQPLLQITKADE